MALLEDSLTAHWKLNDNDVNTTVVDSSGNGNTGTSARNTSLMSAAGKINTALNFAAASSDQISVSNYSIVSSDTDRSISFWVKVAAGQPNENISFFQAGANIYSYAVNFGNSGENAVFPIFNGSTAASVLVANELIFTNSWHHIVITVDRTAQEIKVYLDSVLKDTSDMSGVGDTSGAQDFYIGSWSASRYLDGLIDNMMTFSKALTALEVQLLYNGGAGVETIPIGIHLSRTGQRFSSFPEN